MIGIRTPWTLSDERVWHRTHRVASWLFTIAGLVGIGCGLLAPPAVSIWLALGAVCVAAVGSVGHSWWVYRELHPPSS